MVKNIFIGLVLGWFVLLVFMPKQELYYKLEQELSKNDIKINEKRLESGLFSLTLYESDIYVKGIKLATVEKVNFFTLLLFTKITTEQLHIDDSLKALLPTQIDTATMTHAIWKPIVVDVLASGLFGGLDGAFNLKERTMRLDFNDSNSIGNLKPTLQEDEKGWYYETSF
jgi:hypothetical protein